VTQFSERPRYEIGRVIERTFGVVGHNFLPFFILSLFLSGVPFLAVEWTELSLASGKLAWRPEYLAYGLIGFLLSMLCSAVLQGALLQGAIADLGGGKASLAVMLRAGLRNAPKLFAIGLLIFIMMAAGFILLFVPGLIVLVLFAAAAPAAVAEHKGVFASLQRSLDLTRNHRWAIFGLSVVFLVMIFLAIGVLTAVILGVGLGMGLDVQALHLIIDAPVNAVEVMLISTAFAAQYRELLAVKDGGGDRSVAKVFE
jgi:hypothetical protein